MKIFIEKNYKKIIIAILGFVAIVSVLNAKNDSLIYDEAAHIPASYSYLTEHDFRLNPEHPPLIKDLSAVPLLFMDLNFDTNQSFWDENPNDAQWNAGKYFLFNAGNDPNRIVFWSRLPIIIISLLLGLLIFKWTRELAGLGAGLFALLLYGLDPNVLGHNHFVTTDLGIAAFITFSFYYFLRFIKEPTWKNVFVSGFFLALMQLAKFSSVIAFPVFGLVIIIYPLIRNKSHHEKGEIKFKIKTLGKYLGRGIVMFAFSLILVWIAYYFNTYAMPESKLPETINYYFHSEDTNLKAVYSRQVLFYMNDHFILRPLAEYFFGIARVFQRVAGGNVTYFMGEINTQGFFSYFPIVFLIKEPLAILFFIFLALGISFFGTLKNIFSSSKDFFKNLISIFAYYLRTNIVGFSLLIFIITYSITSITGRLNIGFRHLFPILPFIYILTAKVIFDFLKRANSHTKLIWKIVIGLMLLSLTLETVGSYPYYMSYFNQLVGGPKNGYQYATDSNADWGQDLKRLKNFTDRYNWCPENSLDSFCKIYDPSLPPIEKIRVDYFGMADAGYYLRNSYLPWWKAKRPVEPGWYAISALFLQEGIYNKNVPDNESYRWLKNMQPFSQVGTSIFLYYVTPEEATKINLQ
ncbi:MAG TPA: glycosyltransferase family 39 protein [Candidatus Moranbacteria bacterium]|nr:glycosyltransferase family 39 protein [Candidatus Moranbacteria bacterium]